MRTRFMVKAVSIAICTVLTIGVMFAYRGFSYFADIVADYRGYDYETRIASGFDWAGPKRDEIIDTKYLLNRNNVSLAQIPKSRLSLLTVVDPSCGACKLTREQFRFLSDKLPKNGIDYYVVTFSPNVTSAELSEYVKSLGLDANSFAWSNGLESVLPSLKTIAYPSQILIDSNGKVIKSFPGTNPEKRVRERMVRQVLKEAIGEKKRHGYD